MNGRDPGGKPITTEYGVTNKDLKNPHDLDAKTAKMKNGRTHRARNAEYVVDLSSGAVVAVTIQVTDGVDTISQKENLKSAAENLADLLDEEAAAKPSEESLFKEVVADRGYRGNAVLETHRKLGTRSNISEPKRPRRRWQGKKKAQEAVYGNRHHVRGERSKALHRFRAEKVERSPAHCYGTGEMRRLHLRGHANTRK